MVFEDEPNWRSMKWFKERGWWTPRKPEGGDPALSKMPGLGEGSRRNPELMNKLIGHWGAPVAQKLSETPNVDIWQRGKMPYSKKKMNFGCWKRASGVGPKLSLLPRLLSSLCLSDGMGRKHFRVERSAMGGLGNVTAISKKSVEKYRSFGLVCTYLKCDFHK